MWNGCWVPVREHDATHRRHRSRSASDRRALGSQRLQRRVRATASRLRRRSIEVRVTTSPAIVPSSSAGTARGQRPAALGREALSGRVGAGLDPCAALQVAVRPAAGRRRATSCSCLVRAERPERRRARSCERFRGPVEVAGRPLRGRFGRTGMNYWRAVHVRNPRRRRQPAGKPVAACTRCWLADFGARSGLLPVGRRVRFPRSVAGRRWHSCIAEPALARAHLLHCRRVASFSRATSSTGGTRPTGRGVRTRFSDDLLWLPLRNVRRYITRTRRRGQSSTSRLRFWMAEPLHARGRRSLLADLAIGRRDRIALRALRDARSEHGLRLRPARPAPDGFAATGTTA